MCSEWKVLALMMTLSWACSGESETRSSDPVQDRPNILLVTIDTLRADRVGAYGDTLAKTPNLDALADQSVLFDSAWSVAPLTLPAHTSIMTGLYPYHHGVHDNGEEVSADVITLAERLSTSGYQTMGAVSAYVLDGTFGLDQGFDHYRDDFHPEDIATAVSLDSVERPARDTIREAVEWWSSTKGERFLWVHLFEPHSPYRATEGGLADPYRNEVFEVDRALKRLFEAVGDDTLVVLTADHGENLWDGQELHHGSLLTRSALKVPLLIRPPGGVKGVAVEANSTDFPPRPESWSGVPQLTPVGLDLTAGGGPVRAMTIVPSVVSLVDITPTILQYANIEVEDLDGRSLRDAIEGGSLHAVPVLAETLYPTRHFGYSSEYAAIDSTSWLSVSNRAELYQYQEDPWLQSPLSVPPSTELSDLVAEAREAVTESDIGVDSEMASQLAALGYVTPRLSSEWVDESVRVSEKMGVLHRLAMANQQISVDPEVASKQLLQLVSEESGLVDAWSGLGMSYALSSKPALALKAYQEALSRSPNDPLLRNNQLVSLRTLGRHEQVIELAQHYIDSNPNDPRWYRFIADAAGRLERPDLVKQVAISGLTVSGSDPYLAYMLGLAYLQKKQQQEAVSAFDRAIENGSRAKDVQMWRGEALAQLGRVPEAVEAYRLSATENPTDLRPVVAAGMLLAATGDCEEAGPYLHNAVVIRGVTAQPVLNAYKMCSR